MCSPGDHIEITGIYMPSALTGFAAMRNALIHDTHIEAYKITKDRQNFREYMLGNKMMDQVD
jgi:DNA replicative helicase MCM subunit Mcm2 (Cdc46/Mcm family)